MQLRWRSIGGREVDHELLWLSISVGGLVVAAAWLTLGLPWPICWFHQLTGYPCATCGVTRAAIAFFHGDLLGAARWNPLAFAVYCAIALFDAYAFSVVVLRGRRLRASFTGAEKRILRGIAIAVLVVNWIYLLDHSGMFNG
jgi:hypothetical protein